MPIKRLVRVAEYSRFVDPSVVDDVTLMEDFRAIAGERAAVWARRPARSR